MHRLIYLGISSTTLNPGYLVGHKVTDTTDCSLSNALHALVQGNCFNDHRDSPQIHPDVSH